MHTSSVAGNRQRVREREKMSEEWSITEFETLCELADFYSMDDDDATLYNAAHESETSGEISHANNDDDKFEGSSNASTSTRTGEF